MFIRKAAILYERGGLMEGLSYAHIQSLSRKLGITGQYKLGFVDSSDNFVKGKKALKIAKAAGQVPESFEGPMHPEDIFGTGELDNAVD